MARPGPAGICLNGARPKPFPKATCLTVGPPLCPACLTGLRRVSAPAIRPTVTVKRLADGFGAGGTNFPADTRTRRMTSPTKPNPVIFIHGLWIHATAWQLWLELFENYGYAVSAPG